MCLWREAGAHGRQRDPSCIQATEARSAAPIVTLHLFHRLLLVLRLLLLLLFLRLRQFQFLLLLLLLLVFIFRLQL